MKINDNGRIHSLQPYQKNNASSKTGQVNPKGASRDELLISSEALEMSRGGLSQMDAQQRITRGEHFEQIKQSVQKGTYEIDARKVADKIARYLLGE